MTRIFHPCALALLFLFPVFSAHAADDLELQLLAKAPEIVTALHDAGYQNVGVLKFHVQKGENPLSDRVGSLNRRLSDKLELALVLKNDPNNPQQQIEVLRDPNKIAATIPGAAHSSAEGRKKLFTAEYPLSWGKRSVTPDVFVIGTAKIAADLKTMDIFLRVFDRHNPAALKPLCMLDGVKLDLEDLLDAGESFSVRGVFDGGKVLMAADQRKDEATATAVQTSLLVKPQASIEPQRPTSPASVSPGHPLSPDSNSPISLHVYYDNQPQPIHFQGGIAFVAEPRQGQIVRYEVHRKGGNARLGVVLKVNGENTLYKQRMSDEQCTPWVFESQTPAFSVSGFRTTANIEEAFAVLSQSESKAKEVDYGEFAGTISVTVFPEKSPELAKRERQQAAEKDARRLEAELKNQPLRESVAEGDDFAILNRAEFPTKPGESLKDLKNTLGGLARSGFQTRGLVVNGDKKFSQLKTVPFEADRVPILSATVRYYNPSDLPK